MMRKTALRAFWSSLRLRVCAACCPPNCATCAPLSSMVVTVPVTVPPDAPPAPCVVEAVLPAGRGPDAASLKASAYRLPSAASASEWTSLSGESKSANALPSGETRRTRPPGSVPAIKFPCLSATSEMMCVSLVSMRRDVSGFAPAARTR